MKTIERIYGPTEAVPLMGIRCTKNTADRYIAVMSEDGLLETSYRQQSKRKNKSWCITESDITYIGGLVRSGQYVPHVKKLKKAA